jgi:hypothetical protein
MSYEEIYAEAIANGASPIFADMLASRQPPGKSQTEMAYMQGKNCNQDLDKMPKQMREDILTELKQAGVSVSWKWYHSGLARFRNDPQAWVSGRDDHLRICKERGLNSTGNINYKAPMGLTRKQKEDRKEAKSA